MRVKDMPQVPSVLSIALHLPSLKFSYSHQLGVRLLALTPSRGYSAELAAGLTISLASFYGIPVSTTQIIVGCEMGVGLTENIRTGLNFGVLFKTFLGWIWTILLSLGFCAILFSMGAYAPSITMSNAIKEYRTTLYSELVGTVPGRQEAASCWWLRGV